MTRLRDHTSMGGGDPGFPPTHWTRILSGKQQEVFLAELYQAYWKPIYCYLRAMGFGNEHAKDLVQGFFSEKVFGEELLRKADPQRGSFRSFLRRAVHNYAVSTLRADRSPRSLGIHEETTDAHGDPEAVFDRTWAEGLLQDALKELELECSTRGKLTHWGVFHDWLLEADRDGEDPRMECLCCKHGDRSGGRATPGGPPRHPLPRSTISPAFQADVPQTRTGQGRTQWGRAGSNGGSSDVPEADRGPDRGSDAQGTSLSQHFQTSLVEKICGSPQAQMMHKPLPGKHLGGNGHACILNTMTSAAILSAKPIGQRLKLGQQGGNWGLWGPERFCRGKTR